MNQETIDRLDAIGQQLHDCCPPPVTGIFGINREYAGLIDKAQKNKGFRRMCGKIARGKI
ncbi:MULTISPECIES: hypothetical protein [unclassified Rhizobium]|uniref:hypothetical protein n=1 Tax=unclassified Rhizobium TaxID=2613769 RepID=UPI001619E946|nr:MULTISPECIES: hypothetical protein [unclassified Rhizobium]MBB3381352.1 uncharacterized protein (DUF2237 family) [Rhizobium sp. BK098]MBB3613054.1 uncharacterized protein (DUF2237 family) [Rhizobium sp. BK609]MBB3678712.1 uncharacterized protein (DUF2237 family) [Rhizobium sp. BK612]